MNDFDLIGALSAISDEDADRLISEDVRADFACRIMAMPAGKRARQSASRARSAIRRRWLIGTPIAVGLAAALLVAMLIGRPGGRVGPIPVGPPKAEALVFTRHGQYIDVRVRNPVADSKRYRAEFRAHGLDITLKLVPASPSLVGTVVYFDGSSAIKVLTAKGKCRTGGGGDVCPVGLRVPVDYRGAANLVFGRAARPGERYETTASATAPGEVLHGLRFRGLKISAVLALLRGRHVTAPVFHVTTAQGEGKLVSPSKVPMNWYVYDADPWAPGQVMLWVGQSRRPAPGRAPSPGQPVPSPAPSSGAAGG